MEDSENNLDSFLSDTHIEYLFEFCERAEATEQMIIDAFLNKEHISFPGANPLPARDETEGSFLKEVLGECFHNERANVSTHSMGEDVVGGVDWRDDRNRVRGAVGDSDLVHACL
jgi:hypothetical protein